ncbi:MAG: OB-fold nucleic acid binding domain-containing protein [Actinomycetota bacterium]|nr:OB-fold nucleic acid binding domain-containing protein [Actinomycetota bacterium]MDQ3681117.1 OB-fold nucleic acid binding domain-containing protein [Actinomycetota bacterium]
MELNRALKRLRAPTKQLDRERLRSFCANCPGSVPIAEVEPRAEATVVGEITCVAVVPRPDGSPWLEVTVNDGTGSLRVLWTGRRRIAAIKPGQRLMLSGRCTPKGAKGRLTLYNPKYELLA